MAIARNHPNFKLSHPTSPNSDSSVALTLSLTTTLILNELLAAALVPSGTHSRSLSHPNIPKQRFLGRVSLSHTTLILNELLAAALVPSGMHSRSLSLSQLIPKWRFLGRASSLPDAMRSLLLSHTSQNSYIFP
jgi:hypothetical protein